MTDRVPTQVLSNGAIRYAEYNSSGSFVAYRYLLPADAPTDAGTPINKATLLDDTTASLIGVSGANATPNMAMRSLKSVLNQAIVTNYTAASGSKIAGVQWGTYTGTGPTASGSYQVLQQALTFSVAPKIVIIAAVDGRVSPLIIVRGATKAHNGAYNGTSIALTVAWSYANKTVRYSYQTTGTPYETERALSMCDNGVSYTYAAIL